MFEKAKKIKDLLLHQRKSCQKILNIVNKRKFPVCHHVFQTRKGLGRPPTWSLKTLAGTEKMLVVEEGLKDIPTNSGGKN